MHAEPGETNGQTDTVGAAISGEKSPTPTKIEDTNMGGTVTSKDEQKHNELPEAPKDHGDDGGEVVIGEEDTVIY